MAAAAVAFSRLYVAFCGLPVATLAGEAAALPFVRRTLPFVGFEWQGGFHAVTPAPIFTRPAAMAAASDIVQLPARTHLPASTSAGRSSRSIG